MKVVMPQEIEVWYILPAIRRGLAKEMFKLGMKQKDVAERLGVTEAAVSQYRSSKRAEKVAFDSRMRLEIQKSAKAISKGANPVKEIQHICSITRDEMMACKISKSLGFAPKNCRKCFS